MAYRRLIETSNKGGKMMKPFTKDMLIPGKHVVELRNGKRYLVAEYNEKKYLTNFAECFNSLSVFDEEMKYTNAFGCRVELEDVMKVFVMTTPVPMGKYLFDDEYLTEIWHREEIFITPDEKAILRNIKGYEYIARDEDKELFVYEQKPVKRDFMWDFTSFNFESMCAFCDLFQMVKWTDDEPWKIEDLLNLPEKNPDGTTNE